MYQLACLPKWVSSHLQNSKRNKDRLEDKKNKVIELLCVVSGWGCLNCDGNESSDETLLLLNTIPTHTQHILKEKTKWLC